MKVSKICVLSIMALFAVAATAQSRGYQRSSSSSTSASSSSSSSNGSNYSSTYGEGAQSEGQPQGHHPPPQAFAACENKTAGAECSFMGRNNETRTGTCFALPGQEGNSSGNQNAGKLVCRPAHHGEGNGQGGHGSQGGQGNGQGGRGSSSPE